MKTNNRILRLTQVIFLTCFISACDGGIFGTGDGQNIIVDNADADNGLGSGAPNESTVDSASEADSLSPPVSNTTQPFENLQLGTTTTTPLVNIINVGDQSVLATLGAASDNIFTAPIAAGTFSQTAELQLGENTLTLSNSDTSAALFTIHPLTVGASSLTTIIVRNNSNQVPNVVLLSSMSASVTPSMAQLRIVQANLLSEEDTEATFTLQPTGDEPGSAEASFFNVSVASASSANYQTISPGGYRLLDSLNRVEAELLNLQADTIYTLLILGDSSPIQNVDQDTPILLHEDSLLAR